jgi:hypothetical protein
MNASGNRKGPRLRVSQNAGGLAIEQDENARISDFMESGDHMPANDTHFNGGFAVSVAFHGAPPRSLTARALVR